MIAELEVKDKKIKLIKIGHEKKYIKGSKLIPCGTPEDRELYKQTQPTGTIGKKYYELRYQINLVIF